MSNYRILITGSRTWNDFAKIYDVLMEYVESRHQPYITLVSGGCPTGADMLCERFAHMFGWRVERHPAQWVKDGVYDKRAGFLRNAEMVNLGADVCIAFIKDNSKGATMTAELAQAAHIPTKIYRDEDD
jgi:hypothetical protein